MPTFSRFPFCWNSALVISPVETSWEQNNEIPPPSVFSYINSSFSKDEHFPNHDFRFIRVQILKSSLPVLRVQIVFQPAYSYRRRRVALGFFWVTPPPSRQRFFLFKKYLQVWNLQIKKISTDINQRNESSCWKEIRRSKISWDFHVNYFF